MRTAAVPSILPKTSQERNITRTAKILLFYQTYSGGLGFIHLIFTQNTENHAIKPILTKRGIPTC